MNLFPVCARSIATAMEILNPTVCKLSTMLCVNPLPYYACVTLPCVCVCVSIHCCAGSHRIIDTEFDDTGIAVVSEGGWVGMVTVTQLQVVRVQHWRREVRPLYSSPHTLISNHGLLHLIPTDNLRDVLHRGKNVIGSQFYPTLWI